MSNIGFMQTMMQGALSANTMMQAANAQRSAMAKTEGQMRILETEIKLGTGATELKEKELDKMQERLETAEDLQLNTLENANTSIDKALENARDEESKKADEKDKEDSKDAQKIDTKTVQEIYQEAMEKNNKALFYSQSGTADKSKSDLTGMAMDYML